MTFTLYTILVNHVVTELMPECRLVATQKHKHIMAVPGWAASDTWLATLIVAAAILLPAVMDAGKVSSFTIQSQSYSANYRDNLASELCYQINALYTSSGQIVKS
jgi:hypothetical protein